MKRIKYFTASAFAGAMVLGFWGCGHEHGDPTVKILQPADGSSVAGPDVLLRIQTTNFGAEVTAEVTTVSADDGGHIHVFLDKPITTDAEADTVIEAGIDSVTLKGLLPGSHYLYVQGGNQAHVFYPGMRDSVTFNVTP